MLLRTIALAAGVALVSLSVSGCVSEREAVSVTKPAAKKTVKKPASKRTAVTANDRSDSRDRGSSRDTGGAGGGGNTGGGSPGGSTPEGSDTDPGPGGWG